MSKISDKLREKIKRNNEEKFLKFMQDRVDEFNRAEISANKIKDHLNTGNYIQSIFGVQSENLDKLIIDIQSSEEWKNINTKSKKLLTLNSNLKNNRKKLRKWLLEESPTKNLSKYLAYEDKIKANITQMLEIVKNGRALIQPVFDDPHSKHMYNSTLYQFILKPQYDNDHLVKLLDQVKLSDHVKLSDQVKLLESRHCGNGIQSILFEETSCDSEPRAIIKLKNIKEELDIIILELENSMHEILIFIKDWQEQSKKDNVMLVNLNELIELHKESVCMCESDCDCESVCESVCVCDCECVSEAKKLQNILNARYLFDK
jgi:hypothetical protein